MANQHTIVDMHKHIAHKHTNLMNKIKGFKRTKYRHFDGERMKIAYTMNVNADHHLSNSCD